MTEDQSLVDLRKFEFLPKTKELMGTPASQKLAWGGIRSGKTQNALMWGIFAYSLKYRFCDILVLRRNFKELESGAILDFKTLVPRKLYKYDQAKHIATFFNGSRVVFGHCMNNSMRDIEQYLGQAYPFCLIDECAQFSPDAWELLVSRNTVNPGCQPDEAGGLPVPVILGCTNPLGPFWGFYNSVFVDCKPWDLPEKAYKDDLGNYWVDEAGSPRLVYNKANYQAVHSTPLDNPHVLARDPGLIQRLKGLSKAKMEKMLLGLAGKVEGMYFDVFDTDYHVVNLKEDPDAIIWQPWQPIWGGGDWGMGSGGHWIAFYLFTKGLVRDTVGGNYRLKTICFKEFVERGKTDEEMSLILARGAKIPGLEKACEACRRNGTTSCNHPCIKLSAIYFSHEKFARQMEANSPAAGFSKHLVKLGLCPVTAASRDRIGGASHMYNSFKKGTLCILSSCQEIIKSIPALETDPLHLDDVFKPEGANKADDCYDGFRYGCYGELQQRNMPESVKIANQVDAITDPMAKKLFIYKMAKDKEAKNKPGFAPKSDWRTRV